MAYLLDPGEGKYLLEDLALRYLSLEVHVARRARRARSTSTARRTSSETGRRAVACSRLADALAEALEARELTDLYERVERPLVRVLAQDGGRGHPHRPRVPRGAARRARRAVRRPRAQASTRTRARSSTSTRRRSCGAILFEKLGLTPVKKTKTGPSTDADSLAEDGRGAPDRRGPAALPRGREAAQHVRRRAPAADRRRRPHPRHVQPDRHHDGPHLERGTRTCRTSRCAPPTAARCGGRSSPTTAAGCSPPTTRRSSCACSPTSPRTRA